MIRIELQVHDQDDAIEIVEIIRAAMVALLEEC